MIPDYYYPEETEVVDFYGKNAEGVFGRADNGVIVFVDRYRDPGVQKDEVWICRLCRNNNPEKMNYWAWPLDKVGSEDSKKEIEAENEEMVQNEKAEVEEEIRAIGMDTIYSEMFNDKRYIAYRSLNGAYLELTEDSKGDIVCKNNEVSIEGLDTYIGTEFPVNLSFTRRADGFLIKLEQ